jgi:hypothetical protein
MIDEYVSMCETLFTAVGRPFTTEQLSQVRTVLEGIEFSTSAAEPGATPWLWRVAATPSTSWR